MRGHELVSDELWTLVEPLLPPEPPKLRGGRPRVHNRATLCGILDVLRTGIRWRMLPVELGGGSGVTCWRRLRDWALAGVWQRLHRVLLARLDEAGKLDWSRVCVDSASSAAREGATRSARIRRIVASRGPNVTSWWSGAASRSRRG